MRASGTFKVVAFTPTSNAPDPTVRAGRAVGVATIRKQYEGDIAGRSATLLTAALDHFAGGSPYVAVESFEGTLDGRDGAFNFAHTPATGQTARPESLFRIMPTSGTGRLAGIRGTGGMAIDADGTHRIWFDYELG
ncbi:DUF3224 domain-containing protein [Actinospica durhamensis]|uniref:DUF3224 domain-containing protein n=1 Tax=Actinospica durhamensis TaxID=1508375 RepID=A0A941EYE2_9ACTN|nr:DUF3224 domain-containing protein [Actinospica durhamensis]MBR7838657.1 DUF3224 domain-containing protein [Actinospica durhamensis]